MFNPFKKKLNGEPRPKPVVQQLEDSSQEILLDLGPLPHDDETWRGLQLYMERKRWKRHKLG